MARTRTEWNAYLESWATTAGYSTSSVAEWKTLRDLVVTIAMLVEFVVELFKKDVENYLATKQPGTVTWYADIAKEFQYGDNLQIVNGKPQYVPVDESHRIVTQASVREDGIDNVVYIKAAKTVGSVLAALTTPELAAFVTYMEARQAPGTFMNVSSQAPDSVKYSLAGSFNPLYAESNIQAALSSALTTFRDNFRFDGVFYVSELIEALNAVDGFILNTWTLEWWDGTAWVVFTDNQSLYAGYFNWDGGSSLALTSL